MKRALLIAAGAVVVLALSRVLAEACSCAVPKPASEAFKDAGLVVAGKVEEVVGTDLGPKTIRFTVTEAFRGVDAKEVLLESRGGGSAACEFTFRAGQEYLVYASKRAGGGWETSICTRTNQVRLAAEDLKYLRLARPR